MTAASASPDDVAAIVQKAVATFGKDEEPRVRRGVTQVAALWLAEDGNLEAFVLEHYIADAKKHLATFARFEQVLEQLDGHFLEINRELRRPTDLDTGPLLAVDPLLSALDASAHLTDDLFASKVAFVALLNFPLSTLEERLQRAASLSRQDWAEARLTARFARRVPAAVNRRIADAGAKADLYIAQYNIWMHHVLDARGARLFPSGKKLISHWNLRDELKAQYAAGPDGLTRQRLIVKVMERIVTQTIPAAVIDNPRLDWEPFSNAVRVAPAAEVEADAPPVGRARGLGAREPDTRYAMLLEQFQAWKAADPYAPSMPSAIRRAFELGREMPEARVRALFDEILSSPLVSRSAALIRARLGRALEPQDLWYDGFRARSTIAEAELDAATRKKYPTVQAVQDDLPRILRTIGFDKDKADWLAARIVVDSSRGAGHALQAARRGDFPHLRTRIADGGMDYKGYNIAIHELGHNVEQVFSLYGVDHTLLAGVPNNAFTEAMAFVFQARDLEVLGIPGGTDAKADAESVLNSFWSAWEIAGVALVDVAAWHWMYDHPGATPAETRDAVIDIARDVWRRYYAPVLGGTGTVATPLLGIYSHMIAYPLYLSDYPLGHLIAFQVSEHLREAGKQGKTLGGEFERMTRFGNVAPDVWMAHATGEPVSAAPLLRATERAVAVLAR